MYYITQSHSNTWSNMVMIKPVRILIKKQMYSKYYLYISANDETYKTNF